MCPERTIVFPLKLLVSFILPERLPYLHFVNGIVLMVCMQQSRILVTEALKVYDSKLYHSYISFQFFA